MIGTHRIPAEQFDGLAHGDGGAPAVATLRAGQLSKRMLQLRALLDLAAGTAASGPETAVSEHAFELLAEAQRLAPGTTEQVLLHPPVGAWAAHCVARLRPSPDQPAPAAAEVGLGYFGAIAASTTILARPAKLAQPGDAGETRITVPLRAGRVVLPMLGRALFPGPPLDGQATVHLGPHGVSISSAGRTVQLPTDPSADGPGWRAIRRLRTTAEGQAFQIWLDDADPFREYAGLDLAGELPEEEIARWESGLTAAWSLLVGHHQEAAGALAAGLSCLVPLVDAADGRGVSATAVNAFGAAAMTPPSDGATLAVGLIHEFQHSKLSALLDLVPLYERDNDVLLYAPWRDDPRPLAGLLQGAYAYLGVTSFWRRHRHLVDDGASIFAHFQFARWREQAARAAEAITDSGVLTESGHRFVSGMADTLSQWAAEPVPAEALQAAREATLDHWLIWRLRNLHPAPDAVTTLAIGHLADAARPIGPAPRSITRPGRFAPLQNDRLTLLHQRLRADHADPQPGQVRQGDLDHAKGDWPAAEAHYRREIDSTPRAAYAWAGLALTSRKIAGRPSETLCRVPELVAAVHEAIRERSGTAVDPMALASWLRDLDPSIPVR